MSEPSKNSDLHTYRRLLTYVTPYWPAFLFSIFGFMLYAMANVGFAQLLAYIVDSLGGNDVLENSLIGDYVQDIVGERDSLSRTIIPLSIVCMVFIRGLGTFIGNYFINFIGTTLVHTLRVELFERILTLPSSYFDKNQMGHLVAKITFHVTQVTGAATNAVTVLIREGLTVAGYLAFLLYINWKLTLIFFCVAPVIGFLVSFAGKRFRRISERIQTSMGDVTHVASEAVQGYKEVRTFGGIEYERQRFTAVSQTNRRQSMKMIITSSLATPAVQLVTASALAALVWLILDPALLANMSPGDVIAFITVGGLLAKPIRQLTEVNATVQRGLAAANDIFSLFDAQVESDTGDNVLSGVKGKLEFRSVSFAYDAVNGGDETSEDLKSQEQTGKNVLEDINFIARPGETIALVGRSGSGKSTLASLIPKFYAPQSGSILIDDVPIEQLYLANLRSHLAIVTQDVTLFNDTVANNIAYGALRGIDHEDVKQAAIKAYAWDFIEQLEQGLETMVGDDGVLLSGGQRQRLAIARAFLKDAPVLILDEATSALDSESERYIQAALEAVSAGRTTIVIAHRLSTIEKADRILVLDQGRIVEQGSHKELMAKGGHYTSLHNHQEEGMVASEPEAPLLHSPMPLKPRTSIRWRSEDALVSAWYTDSAWVKLFKPLSYVYTLVSRIKRARAKPWQSPVPVVVVGNINLGGTGKSPLVAWLAGQLQSRGFKPGLVSRGYGGRSKTYPTAVVATSDPAMAGDEAVMLVRRTQCPMVVDPNRANAVRHLLANNDCDIVLSDDGLQHYSLGRQFEIAVVDSEKGLGNGLCLPAGPLREPASRLSEVDLVIANGTGSPDLPCDYESMRLLPTSLVHLVDSERTTEALDVSTVHAVAGIGNPERFFNTLRTMGFEPIEHKFEDHHVFQLTDLNFGDSLPVIMTEKDAIKCRLLNPELLHDDIWYLEVEVDLDTAIVDNMLNKIGVATSKSQVKT